MTNPVHDSISISNVNISNISITRDSTLTNVIPTSSNVSFPISKEDQAKKDDFYSSSLSSPNEPSENQALVKGTTTSQYPLILKRTQSDHRVPKACNFGSPGIAAETNINANCRPNSLIYHSESFTTATDFEDENHFFSSNKSFSNPNDEHSGKEHGSDHIFHNFRKKFSNKNMASHNHFSPNDYQGIHIHFDSDTCYENHNSLMNNPIPNTNQDYLEPGYFYASRNFRSKDKDSVSISALISDNEENPISFKIYSKSQSPNPFRSLENPSYDSASFQESFDSDFPFYIPENFSLNDFDLNKFILDHKNQNDPNQLFNSIYESSIFNSAYSRPPSCEDVNSVYPQNTLKSNGYGSLDYLVKSKSIKPFSHDSDPDFDNRKNSQITFYNSDHLNHHYPLISRQDTNTTTTSSKTSHNSLLKKNKIKSKSCSYCYRCKNFIFGRDHHCRLSIYFYFAFCCIFKLDFIGLCKRSQCLMLFITIIADNIKHSPGQNIVL
ncbi:hypothetical protein AYI68_g3612 [Smittium mucronatum]|uniref:Palmitoyltransferase n=1 Tax=Smittium mucronatum TaxID=133383 RepID=A0A1R0GZD6_9FUNG|nr:hypothetical protein AYI68_g3612 [Smittium mucronatum]